ncbi:MAG: HigA family addiction module antidote protein [Bacteroidales bacterium]|jgi:addiction module HigA family antidote|nr:HigA family addiction module antidote protein [Bacteroidales bacterium]
MKEKTCSRNIHPGGMIEEEITYRKLSKKEIAKEMGISYKLFNAILKERQPLTEDIAVKLAEILNIPACFYMSIQLDYNIRAAKEKKSYPKFILKLRKSVAF